MGKYEALNTGISSLFASQQWKVSGVPTFPSNFVGDVPGNEYVRINILASSGNHAGFPTSVSGIVIIDVYVSTGQGPMRANAISDKLDMILAGKQVQTSEGSVQLGSSTLTSNGNDRDNPSLHHSTYTLPFNFFGN